MSWRSTLAAAALGGLFAIQGASGQGVDAKRVLARMDEICDASIDLRISYEVAGLQLDDAVGATAFLRGPLHDYLVVGVPLHLEREAEIRMRTGDGRDVEFIDRVFPYLALARVPKGTVRLVTDTSPSEYADNMMIPLALQQECDALGAAVRSRPVPLLAPDEEAKAFECGDRMAYRGPETGFACKTDGVPYAFIRFWDVERGPAGEHAYPSRYLATTSSGGSEADALRMIGLPVFVPEELGNPAIGFVANARWASRTGQLELLIVPAENVMPSLQAYADRMERSAMALRLP